MRRCTAVTVWRDPTLMVAHLALAALTALLLGQAQGLTLVHFSAQPEPFLTLNTSPKRLNTPSTPALDNP